MRSLIIAVALLGLVAGFGPILTTPVVAQGGPQIMAHRVCPITPGQGQEAVAFARAIADLFDEKWPELQTTIFRPALFPSNDIHFVTRHENMAAWATIRLVVRRDSGYQALVREQGGALVASSCADTRSVNLRRR